MQPIVLAMTQTCYKVFIQNFVLGRNLVVIFDNFTGRGTEQEFQIHKVILCPSLFCCQPMFFWKFYLLSPNKRDLFSAYHTGTLVSTSRIPGLVNIRIILMSEGLLERRLHPVCVSTECTGVSGGCLMNSSMLRIWVSVQLGWPRREGERHRFVFWLDRLWFPQAILAFTQQNWTKNVTYQGTSALERCVGEIMLKDNWSD